MEVEQGYVSLLPSMREFSELIRRELAAARRGQPHLVLDPDDGRTATLPAVMAWRRARGKNVD